MPHLTWLLRPGNLFMIARIGGKTHKVEFLCFHEAPRRLLVTAAVRFLQNFVNDSVPPQEETFRLIAQLDNLCDDRMSIGKLLDFWVG